ncbi:S-adenosyl-L-methionine-dependent methyltransferase [Dendrothele bispora CBS 962.96]|uniref:S-adenosyl-L-methionine-dependent methyltransferase n=1 Tax=Dendrothele bispora (strain CBS 962.96) TaxID=1314807 RepID=A0A4S8M240_DENBC|nr:S-adenosyl-L-methionine-dependent methyltransferase [Dendrothele bispora CBS 962.96]
MHTSSTNNDQTTELDALLQILTTQVASLQASYRTSNTTERIPSLLKLKNLETLGPDSDPSLNETRRLIVSAATQLIHTVQSPIEIVQDYAGSTFKTVALGFVVDVNIPEVIRDLGGEKGMHVDDISVHVGIDTSYIARVLRYLATRHVFKELTPNVFAHNRISILLCKRRSFEEIKADPISRFDDAPFAAHVHMFSDEILIETLSAFSEFLKQKDLSSESVKDGNPEDTSASGPQSSAGLGPRTAFNLKFNTSKSFWEWIAQPGAKYEDLARTVAVVMRGGDKMVDEGQLVNAITTAASGTPIDSSTTDITNLLPLVVDVGGSSGSATFTIKNKVLQDVSGIKYVVQDLERPIDSARKFWAENDPRAIETRQVELLVHDFFTSQPPSCQNASIYILRMIIHDWADGEAKKILKRLREAAYPPLPLSTQAVSPEPKTGPRSKLIVFDTLARYTCDDPRENLNRSGKEGSTSVPWPLLGNLGVAGEGFSTMMDLGTMVALDGKERTRDDFEQLGKETGWKLESVKPGKLAAFIFSAF